jgi:hypothetical protein
MIVRVGPPDPPSPEVIEVDRIINNMIALGLDPHQFYDLATGQVKDLYAYRDALTQGTRIAV